MRLSFNLQNGTRIVLSRKNLVELLEAHDDAERYGMSSSPELSKTVIHDGFPFTIIVGVESDEAHYNKPVKA